MQTRTFEFKFSIGDIVCHIADAKGRPNRLLVIEQISQTCPDGTQLHYTARICHTDGGLSLEILRFNEMEIRPYPDEAELKERRKKQARETMEDYGFERESQS